MTSPAQNQCLRSTSKPLCHSSTIVISSCWSQLVHKMEQAAALIRMGITLVQDGSIAWTVVDPSAFFKDMVNIMRLVRKGGFTGLGKLLDHKANPIHVQDLSTRVCDTMTRKEDRNCRIPVSAAVLCSTIPVLSLCAHDPQGGPTLPYSAECSSPVQHACPAVTAPLVVLSTCAHDLQGGPKLLYPCKCSPSHCAAPSHCSHNTSCIHEHMCRCHASSACCDEFTTLEHSVDQHIQSPFDHVRNPQRPSGLICGV